MNLFRPAYTTFQRESVAAGRAAQCVRWAKAPFSKSHPENYRVSHAREEMHDDVWGDIFLVANTSKTLNAAWDAEIRSHKFTVEHDSNKFEVFVPHEHYLWRTIPLSCDVPFSLSVFVHFLVGTIFFYVYL